MSSVLFNSHTIYRRIYTYTYTVKTWELGWTETEMEGTVMQLREKSKIVRGKDLWATFEIITGLSEQTQAHLPTHNLIIEMTAACGDSRLHTMLKH